MDQQIKTTGHVDHQEAGQSNGVKNPGFEMTEKWKKKSLNLKYVTIKIFSTITVCVLFQHISNINIQKSYIYQIITWGKMCKHLKNISHNFKKL